MPIIMKTARKSGSKILLLAAAFAWSACSNDLIREDTLPDKGYTLTVDAVKSQATDTRALNPDGSNIAVTWSMDDRVTVLNASNAAIGIMAPTWIEGNKAKLKTTLGGSVRVSTGDRLNLVFPRTGQDYTGQKGTLTDIATNYDYATASVEVRYADASFVSTTDAHFASQQAIVKFNFTDGNSNPINVSNLTISADGLLQNATTTGPVTITPTEATNELYTAISGLNGIVSLNATVGDQTYSYTTPEAKTFVNGQYYPVTVRLKKMPVAYPEPLTLECFDPNGCRVTVSNVSNLEFSRDGGTTWKTYKNSITFKNGEKICFRGTWSTQDTGSSSRTQFACSGKCYIYGNIMSLLDKDNYATMTELPYASTFMNLFLENRDIYHAEGKDLVLPATKLRKNCYANMFNGCTNFNYVKCLATDISASGCTSNWLRSTARIGTFVKADGFNGWTSGDSGIPNNWSVIEE